ncbi:sensor histidine kinase [Paraglaciecola arctica]|uniref:sensor histidine kinase n=1 Tax=Paraglaciecola arctica TaxID=1128911 RepID=UPI001C076538|nr:histidine kinase [Paraglaciecola arctica]MBU3003073.1 histidine kinase [Paraglaciecola arctica]
MRTPSTFWLVQIGIWGGLTLLNLFVRGYFNHYRLGELVNSFSLFVSLMIASGMLRRFYRDKGTDSLPKGIGQALLGSALASLVAVAIIGLVLLPNQEYLFGEVSNVALLQLLASYPNVLLFLLCWSAVYLLLKRQKALKLAFTREAELKEQLAASQMELLLNQLNPHFMFNAINNIRALILEDTNKARDSLAQLSDVLRVTLQTKQDKLWPLSQEIELTKSFIKLNKLQFEERLAVNWHITGNQLEHCQVPCLSLQLLVENAIKHGISNNSDGGMITIKIDAEKDVTLEVSNPGNIATSDGSTQLGITNIQQRLHLLFKDNAHFSLTENEQTVTAKIVIEEP